jgi:hypothetical protein
MIIFWRSAGNTQENASWVGMMLEKSNINVFIPLAK